MNFYSTDRNILEGLSKLFDITLKDSMKVNYSVSYSQNRRLSIVILELSYSQIVHSLIFFYTRSFKLYDIIFYKHKRIYRNINFTGFSLTTISAIINTMTLLNFQVKKIASLYWMANSD